MIEKVDLLERIIFLENKVEELTIVLNKINTSLPKGLIKKQIMVQNKPPIMTPWEIEGFKTKEDWLGKVTPK